MSVKFVILGSGSSMGVPRADGYSGDCDLKNKKNFRTRCSALIKFEDQNILIDTSPDLRSQLLKNNIRSISKVFYTHLHADQTHGINDLRPFFLINKKQIPVYADLNTKKYLSSNTPVILKISPDINDADIDMICKNILEFNLDGLVLTNTSVKLRENLVNKQKNEMGGVSGTPIKDTSNLIIKKFFKTLKAKVPIIGVGGINSGISAYEKIRAGASLLQLYTGLVYKGPFVVRAIKQELAELLRRDGFSSLQKAVGVDSE